MSLTGIIESAEFKFKQILEEYFISVFCEKSLSSHGIDHHRRVWNYAKELLLLTRERNAIPDDTLPFKLIIASYLHDIGMSVDPGIRHGRHSRDLCLSFFYTNQLEKSDYNDVLLAIENHDNKKYKSLTGQFDLLTILSVADDLDAFGFTGIYRYSDIYLTRDINPMEIGHLIIENAAGRFNHFERIFGFSDKLVQKHRLRYLILDSFFKNYNLQVPSYYFGAENPNGYCGVIEMMWLVIKNKIALTDFLKDGEKYSHDPVTEWFFVELASEMNF
jgi:hypothetical protein